MKKIFIASALFITATLALSTQKVKAQDPSDQTTLNVILSDIKTIEVMDASVDILINDAQKYIDAAGTTGVSVSKPAHLKVTSTGGFSVTVNAATNLVNGGSSIDAGKIGLVASNATTAVGTGLAGLAYKNIPLSLVGDKILSTSALDGGTPESTFDVKYTLSEVAGIANLPSGTYSTVVTYTLTAP